MNFQGLRAFFPKINDEIHFIFNCPHNAMARENLFAIISANCLHFNNMAVLNNFSWLMNCGDINILNNLCEFTDVYSGVFQHFIWN
jgi:hypothetical protein